MKKSNVVSTSPTVISIYIVKKCLHDFFLYLKFFINYIAFLLKSQVDEYIISNKSSCHECVCVLYMCVYAKTQKNVTVFYSFSQSQKKNPGTKVVPHFFSFGFGRNRKGNKSKLSVPLSKFLSKAYQREIFILDLNVSQWSMDHIYLQY